MYRNSNFVIVLPTKILKTKLKIGILQQNCKKNPYCRRPKTSPNFKLCCIKIIYRATLAEALRHLNSLYFFTVKEAKSQRS